MDRDKVAERFFSRKFWFGVVAHLANIVLVATGAISDIVFGSLTATIVGGYMAANVWGKRNGSN